VHSLPEPEIQEISEKIPQLPPSPQLPIPESTNPVQPPFKTLTPFTFELDGWLQSNCQNNSYLVQGLVLRKSLAWAEGKTLSLDEQEFLEASRQYELTLINTPVSMFSATGTRFSTVYQKAEKLINRSIILIAFIIPIAVMLGSLLFWFRNKATTEQNNNGETESGIGNVITSINGK
ncbi:MAG: hypothetical protein ACKO4R_09745, partial [Synechococcales cyanobacterium]